MKLIKTLIMVLAALFTKQVLAHPHSFVDLKNNVIVEGTVLKSFQMEWMLDEITSSELIYEVNNSSDKAKTEKDITVEMVQSALLNHYFSVLYDSKNQPITFTTQPTDTRFEIKNNRVIFYITFHLTKPYDLKQNRVWFSTYEPSYYIAMEYNKEKDISISNASCKANLIQPQVDTKLRLYASSLDKTQSPDMPDNEDYSLGAQFAQKVEMVCD
ncbi:DUF1007 domain-containing protein [Mannheimia varigena]|uniref:DUF1007 family protein n=1 Tax=Mannheimia varigena TaxID=85404 RepID=UPI000DBF0BE0|nr:DUF1007 family protein [Mannheimia varigena]AWW35276.1 DUF1007 domain-containing protein [Mannheimia varigena]MDY2946422.1 DUF1007 family protein [Mannheimia varigena]QLD32888.1 DUF1007 family protein [Mannheimia varigena]